MAAENVVDDTHGGRVDGLRSAADFRLSLWGGAVYLHVVLNALSAGSAGLPDRLDDCSSLF